MTIADEPTTKPWRGRVFLEPGRLLYAGPIGPTESHAHHAFQLVVSRSQPVVLAGGAPFEPVSTTTAVIPPDVEHSIHGVAAAVLLLYVDPEGARGRALRAAVPQDAQPLAWELSGRPLRCFTEGALPASWTDGVTLSDAIVSALVGPKPRLTARHAAVSRVIELLRDGADTQNLRTLAGSVGLSPGRLSHLVSEQVGLPLRRYVLWVRLARAATELRNGRNLTEAAHEAGFADGAHLSRTFKSMFGIAPSALTAAADWVCPPDGA